MPNDDPKPAAGANPGQPPATGSKPAYPRRYSNFDGAAKAYEDGKHRRYELMFAVNGGAAAIPKLFHDAGAGAQNGTIFLGNLTLEEVGVGMIVFTAVMWRDIWQFGNEMRKEVGDNGKPMNKGVFARTGRWVLGIISCLIMAGWVLVIVPEGWWGRLAPLIPVPHATG